MACQQNNIQICVKFTDSFDYLVAADRTHQKVQQQNIIMMIPNPLHSLIRVIFNVHMVAG